MSASWTIELRAKAARLRARADRLDATFGSLGDEQHRETQRDALVAVFGLRDAARALEESARMIEIARNR